MSKSKKFLNQTVRGTKAAARGTARAVVWWWQLPRWVKGMKFILILATIVGLPLIDYYTEWKTYRSYYQTYYAKFHGDYVKSLPDYQARRWADFYAQFYAKYYSSPAFRKAYDESLPSATAENLQYPANSPNARHRTDWRGLALVKQFEGLRLEAYHDAGGKLTIGYGHLIKPGEYYTQLTEPEAQALLQQDLMVAEAFVKRYVEIPLTSGQFSALTSLVYNIGPGNFQRSTLLSKLNKGKLTAASREFLKWNKVGDDTLRGLVRRREAEKTLFES